MAVERDDIDNVMVIGVGLIGSLVVTGLIFLVQGFFLRMEQVDTARKVSTPIELRDYRAEQEAQLRSYAWKDQQKGHARIPIERAKRLTLRDLNDESSGALTRPAREAR